LRDDHDRFEALGVRVLAISAESARAGERYLKANPMPFPVLVDDDHAVFDSYDVGSKALSLGQRPAVFVIDATGVVRYDHVGTQQWQIPSDADVLGLLERLD
jgi:thioredoxin-dependent peroxiredoxin